MRITESTDEQLLQKIVVCPSCSKQIMVSLEMRFIKLDNKTGVVKRTFPHEDHLLLLEIDNNGDIREATNLSLENSAFEVQQFIDEYSQWVNILESLTKKTINMLILDDPENYLKTMSNLTYNISKFKTDFEIISQYGTLKLTSGKLSVFVTLNPRIMDLKKVAILSTSVLNPLIGKTRERFVDANLKFNKTSLAVIYGSPNDNNVNEILSWFAETYKIKKTKVIDSLEINMLKNIIRCLTEWIEIEVE